MSCMVMKKEPLAALANAVEARLNCDYGFWGFEAPKSLYEAFRDCWVYGAFSAEAIYNKLYAFNIKAYNSRYAGHEKPGDDIAPAVHLSRYKIHHGPEYREHGFAVRPWHYHLAKLLDFYIYQTNEDATYRDQLWEAMQEFSTHLKSFIVQNSLDYTDGKWGELPSQAEAWDNRTYTVTEVCPHCESEIEMRWDTDTQGFKAFCPVCGKRLMLCDECIHAEDNSGGRCDFDSEKDGCWRNPPENPPLDSTGKSEFDYILEYIREGSFEGLEEIDRLRALWTAYCLRKGFTVDKDAYASRLRHLWRGLQKNGTSEFKGDDYGRFEYIMGGLL
ncbi:MAG: hypothetical protein HFJ86_12445 [Oscillospiraceae bacterium]|jgi:hypothetical protein|nr:hypothetical protein [Oscillospiraceae bacterium]